MAGKSIDQFVKDVHIRIAKAEGREEGREEGRKIGKEQALSEIANYLRNLGRPIPEIASNLKISESKVSEYLKLI
jgi:predicted transposase YdaD